MNNEEFEQLKRWKEEPDPFTPEELAKRWKISLRTLDKWRSQKKGPRFFYPTGEKGGTVLYPASEVMVCEMNLFSHTGEAK